MHRIISYLAALFLVIGFIGCANDPRLDRSTLYMGDNGHITAVPERGRTNFDNVSYWDGDGISGPPSVLIRIGEQRAYFYKGKELVGISAISTGREGLATTTGKFKIIQKD